MRVRSYCSSIGAILFLFAGCGSDSNSTKSLQSGIAKPDTVISDVEARGVLHLSGTMHLVPVEGGCWKFMEKNGTGYELYGANVDSIHIEGLEVVLKVRPKSNLKSVCMVGQVAELVEIVSLKKP